MKKSFKILLIISLCLIALGVLLIGIALASGGSISDPIRTIEEIQNNKKICFLTESHFYKIHRFEVQI